MSTEEFCLLMRKSSLLKKNSTAKMIAFTHTLHTPATIP